MMKGCVIDGSMNFPNLTSVVFLTVCLKLNLSLHFDYYQEEVLTVFFELADNHEYILSLLVPNIEIIFKDNIYIFQSS